VVIEQIDNLKNTGRVRIGKDEWRADSDTDEIITEGKIIEVTSVDGTHLVVKLSKEGE
jgi:membrane protein implicated in regulation of membrane protease activity